MGMNLEELEQQVVLPSRLNKMRQVYGARDYIANHEAQKALPAGNEHIPQGPRPDEDGLVDARVTVIGPLPRGECNSVSGYWAKCERGTVGCTNHRSSNRAPQPVDPIQKSPGFFPCRIHHSDSICRCSQPQIVNQVMLDNAQSAALHVIGALKGDVKSSKLTREDLDYLAVHVARMMAHWARKALGHTPEQEL